MTPRTLRGRLARAAALTYFLGVVTGLPAMSLAEQISDQDSIPSGVIITDGGKPNFAGGCDYGISCDEPYGSRDAYCTDQGDCYGDSNPCCNDGYKHYCPVWTGGEWIHWRLDGNRLPPLVTVGPVTTSIATVARLNDPSTQILSGDETANDDWRDGFRVFGGVWLDRCRTCGVGVDYFDVGDDDFEFTSANDPTLVVGRPFFNSELGEDDVQFTSVPGQLEGTAVVRSNDSFKGAGLTFNRRICQSGDPCSCNSREFNVLGGYRFYEYDTDLSITENLTVLQGTQTALIPGTTLFVQDRFRTHNEFNGSEIGIQGISKHSCWWFDGLAKVAMGEQHRTVTVGGQTVTLVPGGGSFAAPGGVLTTEVTNIGRFDDSDFVVIPEFRLGIGGQLTHYCSIRAGYNLIIWSDVARAASHLPPGLQVDPRNLSPVQPGGEAEPEFPGIRGSELLAHGLDLSVMFAF